MTKPKLLVYANCQGDEIDGLVRRLPTMSGLFDYERIFLGSLHEFIDAHGEAGARDRLNDVVAIWEQSSQASEQERVLIRDFVPRQARWLRFPALTCSTLWPFGVSDNRPCGYERYAYSDMLAMRVWRECGGPDGTIDSRSDEELFDRYMTQSSRMLPDLERTLERDMLQWTQRDRDCDLPMADFLHANLREQQLFYTVGRASWVANGEMTRQLVAATAPTESRDDILGELAAASAGCLGNDTLSIPVHPMIIERLGLKWTNASAIWHWNSYEFDFRTWVLRCVRLVDCM